MARLTWKDKAVLATRGSQFGAIINCAFGIGAGETTGPRFVGKANVTSDGFVMCDFIDRNGQYRFGAFVGAKSDLDGNVRGLTKHLKLTDKQETEFKAKIASWIGSDWSGSYSKAT
jgi:hypothetical protein